MQCPVCHDTQLTMSERQGIEIDYCPKCRGIWLDRGELDKLIERSVQVEGAGRGPREGGDRYRDRDDDDYYKHKKRKSWLMEIFD